MYVHVPLCIHFVYIYRHELTFEKQIEINGLKSLGVHLYVCTRAFLYTLRVHLSS